MQLEIELAEEVGRVICETCGQDLGPVQPLPETLTFCATCRTWVGNDGREHQIKKEVILKNGKRKRESIFKAEGAIGYEQKKAKGRSKKHRASRRIRAKCF